MKISKINKINKLHSKHGNEKMVMNVSWCYECRFKSVLSCERGKENCVGGLKHSQTRISSENRGMWNVYTSTIYNLSEDKI